MSDTPIGRFTCPVDTCGQRLASDYGLARHLRVHSDAKLFKCEVPGCTKSFNRRFALRRHGRVHIDTYPYPCASRSCGKRFGSIAEQQEHVLNSMRTSFGCTLDRKDKEPNEDGLPDAVESGGGELNQLNRHNCREGFAGELPSRPIRNFDTPLDLPQFVSDDLDLLSPTIFSFAENDLACDMSNVTVEEDCEELGDSSLLQVLPSIQENFDAWSYLASPKFEYLETA